MMGLFVQWRRHFSWWIVIINLSRRRHELRSGSKTRTSTSIWREALRWTPWLVGWWHWNVLHVMVISHLHLEKDQISCISQ
jgi:hypothetical protein